MAVLPLIGAGLGAIEGYRSSGGNLGATLLSAGIGAVAPKGLRMAGSALAATPLGAKIAPALYKGAKAIGRGGPSSVIGAAAQRRAGAALIPGATAALGLGLVPALAGTVASAAAGPARGAAQLGAGTFGYRAPGEVDYAALGGDAVPPIGTFGAGGTLSDPLNVWGRVGMAQRLETLKSAEAQRDALRMLLPEISQAAEFRSKQELQRQLAAAGVRQNIVTAANMLERSQQAAQQMGLNAASQAGAALTQQYQYQ